MWSTEEQYMNAWVWPDSEGGFYCRINGQCYATREEAVEAVRLRDKESGIVWPWQKTAGV